MVDQHGWRTEYHPNAKRPVCRARKSHMQASQSIICSACGTRKSLAHWSLTYVPIIDREGN